MRAQHNSLDSRYRSISGAVEVSTPLKLAIDIWDDVPKRVMLRVWTDEKHEELIPMRKTAATDKVNTDLVGELNGGVRYSTTLTFTKPHIMWYSFQITSSAGDVWRYGAALENKVGVGAFAYGEPPSYQVTIYKKERSVDPTWYTQGIAYQIFPDRFARDEAWQERVEHALALPRQGCKRRCVEDWNMYPYYQRDSSGAIQCWDFYGGSLKGIIQKLDYLKNLGITIIYLNPIVEAASNHRYDTADYFHVDPALGTDADFDELARVAASKGISIMLDGVFNHVGADSHYFNAYGNYAELPAQNPRARTHDWFTFNPKGGYDCWWGIPDLPAIKDGCKEFRELICGRDGVIRSWLRRGARGWRLDVVDELSDDFVKDIKRAALAEKPDAVVIGEVWEDASHKRAYGRLREYFQGQELDATMNYPLRDALISFIVRHTSADAFASSIESLQANYPKDAFYSEFNMMSTHDRARILTMLGEAPDKSVLSEGDQYWFRLNPGYRRLAVTRLWLATIIQMCLPGVPCVYYGDEAGVEGYADPFCRSTFPWDAIDKNCQSIYRNAIQLRKTLPVLIHGDLHVRSFGYDVFGMWRRDKKTSVCVLVNTHTNMDQTVDISVDNFVPLAQHVGKDFRNIRLIDLIEGNEYQAHDGVLTIQVPHLTAIVLCASIKTPLALPFKPGAGVLCHITSLPEGTLGQGAYDFINYLSHAHMHYWQMLPIHPTDEDHSPYAGCSAFAGNMDLIAKPADTESAPAAPAAAAGAPAGGEAASVPPLASAGAEAPASSEAQEDLTKNIEYQRFVQENDEWLLPFALFSALKKRFKQAPWQRWPKPYNRWDPAFMHSTELLHEIDGYLKEQYEFDRAWQALKAYAHERGVNLIGDIPMYVSADSCDVWTHPEMFNLDADGYPTLAAGVPPDEFSATGQLWGNPTYNWERMEQDGFSWWTRRLKREFDLFDYVRLDHFLGFSSYFAIPVTRQATRGSEQVADEAEGIECIKRGQWCEGPGMKVLEALYKKLGPLPLIAEDLGIVTPAVRALLVTTDICGMDVMQFCHEDVRFGYHPSCKKVAYTSTHDTQTLVGWCESHFGQDNYTAQKQAEYLISEAFNSDALVAITTLQDLLHLDDSGRMNRPGTANDNWSWRASAYDIEQSSEYVRSLVDQTGRM